MTSLAHTVRTTLLTAPGVSRVGPARRGTSLYAQGQAADQLYFVEDGLIKLVRMNESGGRIILSICGSGHLVGDEALSTQSSSYQAEAEVLVTTVAFRIPRETLLTAVRDNSQLAGSLIDYLLQHKIGMEKKVELLCLHDVEYRILHYLAQLTALVKVSNNGEGYQLPITQAELADLIGATRETTSTTLNQLERRGLIKLSRRLLTIPSPETLISAAASRTPPASSLSAEGV